MNKIGGRACTRYDDFLKQFLLDNDYIFKYEVRYILKAFKLTILYFFENIKEFEIKDFFKFKKIHKDACRMYIRYRDEWEDIPEYDDMKIETSKKLRNYLNSRYEFKNVEKRQKLPDGTAKFKDIF